jgi:hypothetical protein
MIMRDVRFNITVFLLAGLNCLRFASAQEGPVAPFRFAPAVRVGGNAAAAANAAAPREQSAQEKDLERAVAQY